MKALKALADKSAYARLLSRGGTLFYKAPCMIVVAINSIDTSGYEPVDCGIATQSIALAATSLGIDNLICGLAKFAFTGERSEEFKQRLNFPKGYEIGIAVLLGYAAEPGGKPQESNADKITIVE
jgi:nitroreductase